MLAAGFLPGVAFGLGVGLGPGEGDGPAEELEGVGVGGFNSGSGSTGSSSSSSRFSGSSSFELEGIPGMGKGGGGGVSACACWAATRSGFKRGFRVEVPFRTSHIAHLKASGLFLKVQTLQSQAPSSGAGPLLRFRLEIEIYDS